MELYGRAIQRWWYFHNIPVTIFSMPDRCSFTPKFSVLLVSINSVNKSSSVNSSSASIRAKIWSLGLVTFCSCSFSCSCSNSSYRTSSLLPSGHSRPCISPIYSQQVTLVTLSWLFLGFQFTHLCSLSGSKDQVLQNFPLVIERLCFRRNLTLFLTIWHYMFHSMIDLTKCYIV